MQQNKMIPAAAWIACLTIAAFVLAQASAVIIRRSLDAVLRNAATVTQSRPERAVLQPPRPDASDGNKTASKKTDSVSGVKVEQVSDTEWILDRTSLLANTRNLNRFLMQARTVPYRKQGRIVGFRITGISQGSLYEKIGLRTGDVLLRVNTRNLDNPATLFSLYQEMRTKRHISILLSRNGQDRTLHYDIR
jgi:type II secretory pathway component PulC